MGFYIEYDDGTLDKSIDLSAAERITVSGQEPSFFGLFRRAKKDEFKNPQQMLQDAEFVMSAKGVVENLPIPTVVRSKILSAIDKNLDNDILDYSLAVSDAIDGAAVNGSVVSWVMSRARKLYNFRRKSRLRDLVADSLEKGRVALQTVDGSDREVICSLRKSLGDILEHSKIYGDEDQEKEAEALLESMDALHGIFEISQEGGK